MAYTNRSIVLIIIAAVVLVHGTLFALTMSGVRANGLVPYDFIVTDFGDSNEYLVLAQTMLESGRFARSPTAPPNYFRTPVYPLFVALILATVKNIIFLPIAQIILSAFSAALIFLIGTRFYNRGVGLASAVLFAIDPAVPLVTFVSMADSLFVFMLLVSIYVLCVNERLSYWRIFFGGLLVGIFALTRPIGLYVFPLFVLWLLWEGRNNWKQAFKMVGLFLVGMCLVVLPWMARNYAYSGHATISSIGVYNLLFYNIVTFEHERTGASKEEVGTTIIKQIGAVESDDVSSLVFADKERAVALEHIFAHPFAYTAFHLFSVIPFYIGSSIEAATHAVYSRGAVQGTSSLDINVSSLILHGNYRAALTALTANMPMMIERIIWLILCVASLVTVVLAIRRKESNVSVAVLFFALIVAFGVLTGPVSYPRYRLPVEPFIFILGIAGIRYTARHIKRVYSFGTSICCRTKR